MIPPERFIIFKIPNGRNCSCEKRKCTYKFGPNPKKLVREVLEFNGICETPDNKFTMYWGNPIDTQTVATRCTLQKINHFPDSKLIIGNKAELAHIIQNHPSYSPDQLFYPRTYILPKDRSKLFNLMKKHPKLSYISKPPNGSCGSGIKLVRFDDFYTIPTNSVVSDYISRPLLIDGYKFDMRVYVLVTSFMPLRAYLYREGLARFATEVYSFENKDNQYSYLTNASLNRHNNKKWSPENSKWPLSDILYEINHRFGKPPEKVMGLIKDTVARTLMTIQGSMIPAERNSLSDSHFELLGFDILFDNKFTPYLLEINTMPSLGTSDKCDFEIKAPLISQAFSIVGVPDMSYQELEALESSYVLPKGGIAEYDQIVLKQEEDRNVKSGNGFIRIFPSKEYDNCDNYIVKAPVNISKYNLHISMPIDGDAFPLNIKVQPLTPEQGILVLVFYLTKIENQLLKSPIDIRLIARVQCFLAAQGYRIGKNSVEVRNILHHFIERAKSWITLVKKESDFPEEFKNRISSYNDVQFEKALTKCQLHAVKNVKLLFP